MINVLIAEDIKNERLYVEQIIKQYFPDLYVMAASGSYYEAEQILIKYKPELLLLDIELDNGRLSIELLKNYNTDNKCEVVFISAHSHYALQAIQLSCCDYILKPFTDLMLINAIEKAKGRIYTKNSFNRVELLLQNLNRKEPDHKLIALQNAAHHQKHEVIPVTNILYVASQKDHTSLVVAQDNTLNKKFFKSLLSKGIGEMFELLGDDENFMRVHSQYIINPAFIIAFHKQDCLLSMLDGREIPVSRESRQVILRLLNLK